MLKPKPVIQSGIMRRAFATTLVILLLAMSSWASACDISCSLERSHSICKLQGTAPSDQVGASLSEMAMDPNMVMPDEGPSIQAESETGSTHLHANSCTHNSCNETSVSAISKSAQHPVPALDFVTFERPRVAAITSHITDTAPEREPPNPQPFDPLSVNLRI